MRIMARDPSNIVLIGMPGSGKSTVGVILAKQTSLDFVDTDVLIQRLHGRALQDIINMEGHMALRKIEEDVLLDIDCHDHVIATGGSDYHGLEAANETMLGGVGVPMESVERLIALAKQRVLKLASL